MKQSIPRQKEPKGFVLQLDTTLYLICKECYKKKYGHYPLFNYEDSDGEYVCFIAEKKEGY